MYAFGHHVKPQTPVGERPGNWKASTWGRAPSRFLRLRSRGSAPWQVLAAFGRKLSFAEVARHTDKLLDDARRKKLNELISGGGAAAEPAPAKWAHPLAEPRN